MRRQCDSGRDFIIKPNGSLKRKHKRWICGEIKSAIQEVIQKIEYQCEKNGDITKKFQMGLRTER